MDVRGVDQDALSLQAVQDFQLPVDGSQVGQQLEDVSGFVNHDSGTTAFSGVGQVSFIARLGHAKRRSDGPAGVEEDGEGQAFPLDPVAVGLGVTVIYSENENVLVLEAGMVVTVPVTVAGSISAAGRGEEPEPDFLAGEIRQPDVVAGVVYGGEVRRFIALFWHFPPFSPDRRRGRLC